MATVEERVDVLEQDVQELRHRIDAGLRGNSLGISLVRNDTQEIKADTQEIKADLGDLRADFRRLDNKVTGLDNKVTGIDDKVTGLDNRFTGLESKVDGFGARMAAMEQSLTEVLRRLPEPPG
jgi:predicted  nucleic acid-binding Zn-ribbon protein